MRPDTSSVPGTLGQGLAPLGVRRFIAAFRGDYFVLKYIELKTGHGDNGPAWIVRVKLSKSGHTVYFGAKALKRAVGGGISGNYFDIESGQEYWASGVKKNGLDRHWAGSGIVQIEVSAVAEYLQLVEAAALDRSRFQIIPDMPEPAPARFSALENEKMPR